MIGKGTEALGCGLLMTERCHQVVIGRTEAVKNLLVGNPLTGETQISMVCTPCRLWLCI